MSVNPPPAAAEEPAAVALLACLVELERHIGQLGFDAPPRLFALVPTAALVAAEPALADQLAGAGEDPDALTAVEQDTFDPGEDLVAALSGIEWPDAVAGCAVSCERSFLPAGAEADLPEDPAAAAEAVAAHPARQDVRVLVGVLRDGTQHGVARLVQHPEELLAGADLVPGLAAVLAYTLHPDGPQDRPGSSSSS